MQSRPAIDQSKPQLLSLHESIEVEDVACSNCPTDCDNVQPFWYKARVYGPNGRTRTDWITVAYTRWHKIDNYTVRHKKTEQQLGQMLTNFNNSLSRSQMNCRKKWNIIYHPPHLKSVTALPLPVGPTAVNAHQN